MKTQRARGTLSKVRTDHNKPETERIYYFNCWFDPVVPMMEEFRKSVNTATPLRLTATASPIIVPQRLWDGAGLQIRTRPMLSVCDHTFFLTDGKSRKNRCLEWKTRKRLSQKSGC